MGTMNFSIPDDVKDAFNEAFESENKSAIITDLMRQALAARARSDTHVTEQERQQRFDAAVKRLEAARRSGPTYTDEQIRRARHEGRP